MYLLDTNVVSELRRSKPHGAVLDWISTLADDALFLSAVTIGEIQAGIEKTREQDQTKAAEISDWLDQVITTYAILPMDGAAFRRWAAFMHRQSDTLIEDAMIAATAHEAGLVVATRNEKDFAVFDIPTLNPFA